MKIENKAALRQELTDLLNRLSIDTATDTPDFILADYLIRCLVNLGTTIKNRQECVSSDRPESAKPKAEEEYISATCKEAGYGKEDCSENFWVKLSNKVFRGRNNDDKNNDERRK